MTAATPKGERRRQALVEAASGLLAEGGFDAVRHRAVAERAGLPLASTTYYFDSLDELITAARRVPRPQRARALPGTAGVDLDPADAPTTCWSSSCSTCWSARTSTDIEAVLLRYERLVATGRRPYLRPLMRVLSSELHELIADDLRPLRP